MKRLVLTLTIVLLLAVPFAHAGFVIPPTPWDANWSQFDTASDSILAADSSETSLGTYTVSGSTGRVRVGTPGSLGLVTFSITGVGGCIQSAGGNDWVVVYTNSGIKARTSSDNGGTLSSEITVSGNASHTIGQHCSMSQHPSSGDIWLAYTSSGVAYFSKSTDNGATWSAPTDTGATSISWAVDISAWGDMYYTNGASQVVHYASNDGGATWVYQSTLAGCSGSANNANTHAGPDAATKMVVYGCNTSKSTRASYWNGAVWSEVIIAIAGGGSQSRTDMALHYDPILDSWFTGYEGWNAWGFYWTEDDGVTWQGRGFGSGCTNYSPSAWSTGSHLYLIYNTVCESGPVWSYVAWDGFQAAPANIPSVSGFVREKADFSIGQQAELVIRWPLSPTDPNKTVGSYDYYVVPKGDTNLEELDTITAGDANGEREYVLTTGNELASFSIAVYAENSAGETSELSCTIYLNTKVKFDSDKCGLNPPATTGIGSPDGAIPGVDTGAIAEDLGLEADFFNWLIALAIIFGLGAAGLKAGAIGATGGAAAGLCLSLALGLVPFWAVMLIALISIAVVVLLRGRS